MPARAREGKTCQTEGIEFLTLHNPIEYIGDEKGHVTKALTKMELGEPDESGRRSPVAIPGAIEEIDIDVVIVSVGVSPNPLIPHTVKGLNISKWGTIVVDQESMKSDLPDLYAGGDIVRGGATVILARATGRRSCPAALDAELSHSH